MKPAPSLCVCTSLRMAARHVSRHYDRALVAAGISVTAYAILARLDREGPLAVGALASRLAMDRSTLSREATPLVTAGLVEATRDGRRRILSLAPAGAERLAAARPLWEQAQTAFAEAFGRERTTGLIHELHELVGAG